MVCRFGTEADGILWDESETNKGLPRSTTPVRSIPVRRKSERPGKDRRKRESKC
jgi:hypothetical protein